MDGEEEKERSVVSVCVEFYGWNPQRQDNTELVGVRSVSFRLLTAFSETDTCPNSFDFQREEKCALSRQRKQEGGKDLKSKPLIRCRRFRRIPATCASCWVFGKEWSDEGVHSTDYLSMPSFPAPFIPIIISNKHT